MASCTCECARHSCRRSWMLLHHGRGYVTISDCSGPSGRAFSSLVEGGHGCAACVFASVDRATGLICDQRVMLNGFYSAKNYPEHLRRIRFKTRERQGSGVSDQQHHTARLGIAELYKSRWKVELFFKWIKQPCASSASCHQRERRQKSDLVRSSHLCADRIVKKELKLEASLYTCLQILSVSIFEKTRFHAPSASLNRTAQYEFANQLNLSTSNRTPVKGTICLCEGAFNTVATLSFCSGSSASDLVGR